MRFGPSVRVIRAILFGCSFLLAPAALAAEVLVMIEGESITDQEFLDFTRKVERAPDLSAASENLRMGVLENMLTIRHLANIGRKKGFDSDPDVVSNADKAFRNLVVETYRARYMAANAQITESAAREYYKKNPDKWDVPELITFRHLFINVADLEKRIKDAKALKEAVSEKERKLESAKAEIGAGKRFLEVAKSYSESGGGQRGEEKGKLFQAIRNKGALLVDGRPIMKSFQERLDPLKPGECSDSFRTPNGYEILYLESRRPAGRITFEEARTEIATTLLEGRNRQRALELERQVLARFRIARNYGLAGSESPNPEGVLISIRGSDPADTFTYTIRDYKMDLMGMAIVARERMISRSYERENYLEEQVLKSQCYLRVACKEGVDRDPDLVITKRWLMDALIAAKVAKSEIDGRLAELKVSDQEIRLYYEDPENHNQFTSLPAARFRGFAVPAFAVPKDLTSAEHAVRRLCRKTAQDIIDKYNEGWEFGAIEVLYGLAERPPGAKPTPYQWGRPSDGKRHLGGLMVQAIPETIWLTARDLQMCGIHSTKDWATLTTLEPGKLCPTPIVYLGNLSKVFPGGNGYLVLEGLELRDAELRPYETCRAEARAGLMKSKAAGMEHEVYRDTLKTISYDLNKDVWRKIWNEE